ncbi:MAG TPA: hypothetical protein VEK57_13070 [Thermoanaerobaculia bacterium]|nr:hypothetical protein [Thermoanaerobaculia bacterium]
MKHSMLIKLSVVAVVAILIQVPAYATCTQGSCFDFGCNCLDQIADATFSDSCSSWVYGGDAYLDSSGGDDFVVFTSPEEPEDAENTADIVQTLTVPSDRTTIAVHADVTVINPSVLTERLVFEILNTSGTILETIMVVRPIDGSDYYIGTTSGYGGQTIKLRIRYRPAHFPGGTIFHVSEVHFLTC